MTGRGNATWLIDGREPALVDAGVGAAEHISAVAELLQGRPLAHVLVTHGHADHVSGVPALRARWPGLAAWKCPDAAGDGGGWRALHDGQRVGAGSITLLVVHTPGHAPDHVCFWHQETRALFGGDMVARGTTVMIPASRGGSLRQYLASLSRLRALDPARIFPGHGPIIDRPVELIDEYLAHRAMRERQVRACLADGVTSPDAMVGRIYPDLAPALVPAARDTVLAHLQKIQEDDGSGLHSDR
jgi:hydroxyacylglutathione hydrolase